MLHLILRGPVRIKPLPNGEGLSFRERFARIVCWWSGGHYYVVEDKNANELMASYEKVLITCDRCGKCAYLER